MKTWSIQKVNAKSFPTSWCDIHILIVRKMRRKSSTNYYVSSTEMEYGLCSFTYKLMIKKNKEKWGKYFWPIVPIFGQIILPQSWPKRKSDYANWVIGTFFSYLKKKSSIQWIYFQMRGFVNFIRGDTESDLL